MAKQQFTILLISQMQPIAFTIPIGIAGGTFVNLGP